MELAYDLVIPTDMNIYLMILTLHAARDQPPCLRIVISIIQRIKYPIDQIKERHLTLIQSLIMGLFITVQNYQLKMN